MDIPVSLSARYRPRVRLFGFLSASLCLHAALLLSYALLFHPVRGQPETVLSVTLNAPNRLAASVASRARATVAKLSSHGDNGSTAVASTAASESADPQYALTSLSGSSRDAGAEGTGPTHESARARIQAQLLADLQHYFEYPLLARHRGWQGIVWLSFTVEPDGLLDRIQVAKSSGYDVLDSSAINAMQRVGHLTDAGHWLSGSSLTMQLAVIYRLKDR